jgi:hypothetical protein
MFADLSACGGILTLAAGFRVFFHGNGAACCNDDDMFFHDFILSIVIGFYYCITAIQSHRM